MDTLQGIRYYTHKLLDITGTEWKELLFMINKNCFVITSRAPILIRKCSNAATSIITYEYIIVGMIIDTMLGIWMEKTGEEEIRSNGKTRILGKFNGMEVCAAATFKVEKSLVHVFTNVVGTIKKSCIYGMVSDLIPGVMGPLISDEPIELEELPDWHESLRSSLTIKTYCPNGKEQKIVEAGKYFYIIGPRLFVLSGKPSNPIFVVQKMVDVHLRYVNYLQKKHDMEKLIKTGYTPTDIHVSSMKIRNGLTYNILSRIVIKPNIK